MATPTFLRTFAAIKEQSTLDDGGTAKGNGEDRHMPLGRTGSGDIYRGFARYALDWTGVYQIVKATLVTRSTEEVHVSFGSGPEIEVRRIGESWPSGGGSEGTWTAGAGTKHPGPSTTGTSYASGGLGPAQDKTKRTDITGILEQWAPATVLRSDGVTPGAGQSNHGIRIKAADEGSTNDRYEIYGLRAVASGRRHYIELEYIANIPPNAPIVTSPAEGDPVLVASAAADRLTVSYLFSDADAGDTCQRVELEVYGDAATDGAPGTRLATSGAVTPTALGPLNAFSVTVTGLSPRTNQRYRLRTQDSDDVWGAWTSLEDGRFFTAYRVRAPKGSGMQTTPERPHITGSLDSDDPADFLTGWEGEFYRDDPSGAVTLWAPGVIGIGGSSTRADIEYGGIALNDGNVVRWRHRLVNRDGIVGDWSAWQQTTMSTELGPDAMSPLDVGTKLLTRTPTLTIGHSVAFTGYRWRLYRADVLIHDSGPVTVASTNSEDVVVPEGLLDWGDGGELTRLEWEAAVVVGSLGPYSPRRPIRIDALPSTTLSMTGRTASGYVPTADPVYVAPYTDPDRATYGEWPAAKEYEIREAAFPAGSGTLVKHVTRVSAIVESEQLGATFVPTADQAYDLRVRYRDDAAAKASTTLAADSSPAATNVKVTSVSGLSVGDPLTLESATADEETRTITAVGTSGAGGTGVDVSHGFTLAHTSGDTAKVHYWGPWTPWLTFTYSAPPTVAAAAPADLATVNDPTQALSWTFTSARAQEHADARVYERILTAAVGPNVTLATSAAADDIIDTATAHGFAIGDPIKFTALTGGTGLVVGTTYYVTATSFGAQTFRPAATRGGAAIDFTTDITAGTVVKLLEVDELVWQETQSGTGLSWDIVPLLLATGRTYAWEVEAFDTVGLSGTTARRMFTTAFTVPIAITDLHPGVTLATSAAADDIIDTATAHGYSAGDQVEFTALTGGAGLVIDTIYYVIAANLGATTFQVSATDGGAAIDFSTDITAGTVARRGVLTAVDDAEASSLILAWTASPDAYLHHYRVWWRDGEGAWQRVDTGPAVLGDGKTPLTDTTFTHYGGRLGSNDYRVEAHNGAQSSEPSPISATLSPARAGAWMLVDVDGTEVIAIDPLSVTRVRNPTTETYRPPGRGSAVHLFWGPGGHTVNLTFAFSLEDGDILDALAIRARGAVRTWLKGPEGYAWEPLLVVAASIEDEPEADGLIRVRLSLEEVES